jgi:hypothetical protein
VSFPWRVQSGMFLFSALVSVLFSKRTLLCSFLCFFRIPLLCSSSPFLNGVVHPPQILTLALALTLTPNPSPNPKPYHKSNITLTLTLALILTLTLT